VFVTTELHSGSLNRLYELQMVMCMPLMGVCRERIFVFHHRIQKIYTSFLFFHYDSKRIILCTCYGDSTEPTVILPMCHERDVFVLIGDKCACDN